MARMISSLKALFRARDLLLVFIWRHFSIRYRQSMFGLLWALFQPLSLLGIFSLLFRAPAQAHGAPLLFFLTGLIFWNFFSSGVSSNIPILVSHYSIITKINFPREILPISMLALAFSDFLIAWVLFTVLAFWYHIHVSLTVLWEIPLFFLLLIFTLSVSLLLSCLNVFYRDLQMASGFLLQLWFFVSAVFYSTQHTRPLFKCLMQFNPLVFIIEQSRGCLLYGKSIDVPSFFIRLIALLILLELSYKLFKHVEKKFADVI